MRRWFPLVAAIALAAILVGAKSIDLSALHSPTSKPVALLVTWFVYNQPPSSYQAKFDSAESCETARLKVNQEQQRLEAAAIAQNEALKAQWAGRGVVGPPDIPRVTAVCAAQ
jgi:hypothetical protein